ncbi:hypothetical protein HAU32_00845 [Weissella confusa]|uniref:Uncharacterized protein n=1 Tax=Weissella fermenti TaxID=2987699 RepID=A0ABT6D3F8_9LACO|nr:MULTISPECIES: hypothetical protein [Weissella]MBJ7687551.1 hypothetical protein [Weissella confusa]MCW0927456.1 hypothetical protein [Weissella sp. LMG 11983]MDF9299907.1 hypothetical protein [Weissella sp. BK2]
MDFLLNDLVDNGYVRVPDNFRHSGIVNTVVEKYKATTGRVAEIVEESTDFGSRLMIVDVEQYL